MYSREKLTIKGRASRRVFPSKNALQTKRPVFYSPGEFTGRGSEPHLHKRKVEILCCRGKRGFELKFTPKTKKPTRRPVGGEAKKWSTIFLFPRKILSTSNWRIFRVSKGGANSASRKILREKLELHSASKKSLNIAKMVEKRFELPTSTHDLSYEKIRLADCHKIPIFF